MSGPPLVSSLFYRSMLIFKVDVLASIDPTLFSRSKLNFKVDVLAFIDTFSVFNISC